jgi:hypothetical protein
VDEYELKETIILSSELRIAATRHPRRERERKDEQ